MFCIDTNILIYAINGRRPVIAERLDAEVAAGTRLLVPVIVLMELDYGIAKSDRPARTRNMIEAFLADRFEVLDFERGDARTAADIRAHMERAGTAIGYYDHQIAAQAINRGAALVTLNRREFDRVPGLVVTDWTE